MNSNAIKIVAVAFIALTAFLLLVQPWRGKRYGDTPAGVEVRRCDERIDAAIAANDTWDPASFLGETPAAGIDYPALLAGLSHAEALQLVRDLKSAGASKILLTNVRSGIEKSTGPEAVAVELPQDPAKRRNVWARAGLFFTRTRQTTPPDLRQKYLYLPLRASASTTTQVSG